MRFLGRRPAEKKATSNILVARHNLQVRTQVCIVGLHILTQ